jgi:beta-lactamase superfamily II metal-dependent hydrolase
LTIEIAFLDVGNADSIVILPTDASAVLVDIADSTKIVNWLKQHKQKDISCIYFTHAHTDHAPSLFILTTFISEWLKQGTVQKVILPKAILKKAFDSTRKNGDEKQKQLSQHALARIKLWEDVERIIAFESREVRETPDQFGTTSIFILHPTFKFSVKIESENKNRHNETSLVLSVQYGSFKALLLADVEEEGLTELLKRCTDQELQCNVLKIPHHGAWPSNEADFRTLLQRANPELAILSVGSKNPYGHVIPELFKELIKLQQDTIKHLQQFVCTEVTRTCVQSADDRRSMGKNSLPKAQQCAGDIEIVAEESGNWIIKNTHEHANRITQLNYPACLGLAELD